MKSNYRYYFFLVGSRGITASQITWSCLIFDELLSKNYHVNILYSGDTLQKSAKMYSH